MLRSAVLSLTCVVLALVFAACGQAGSGGDSDPASLAPASAVVYAQAAIRPEGDLRDGALAAAGKVLRTDDPAGKLTSLIDKALAEDDAGLTWESDFAPWLGQDAGVWAANLAGDKPDFAVIVATKDAEAAKATLAKLEQGDKEHTYTKHSYAGVDYALDDDGTADGMIGDYVVIGSESGFKRTADARDGDKLSDSDRYKNAIGDLDEDRLGHYYLDLGPVLDAAAKEDPDTAAQLQQLKSFVDFDKLGPITGSFQADGDGMAVDTVVTGVPDGPYRDLLNGFSNASGLLGELPGDAWAAYAAPKLGESMQGAFNAFAGALGGAAIAGQIKQATGLDLQQDVLSWVGDTGLFVTGSDMSTIGGALVIEATDEDKAAAAFNKIVGLIGRESGSRPRPARVDGADAAFALDAPDAPKPIVLARGNGRVVAAYGEDSAAAAINPSSKLADSETLGAAKDVLGDGMEPVFVLSIPDVIKLVDGMGGADADFEQARPYLEAFGVVTSGGSVDGDKVKSRLAVTLR